MLRAYLYRIRLIASVIVATVLPILITGMVLLQAAEQALLEEKKQKLIAITQQLDFALPKDFDDLARTLGVENASREQKIERLNRALQPLTDRIAEEHPGVGVGYYAANLDAILTYGPSQEMKLHVGEAISPSHLGRKVMQSGKPQVAIGEQVRGNIMNAMYPLMRNGQMIGYTWANELMSSIDVQLAGMRRSIYTILGIGCLVAAVVSGLLVHRLEAILEEIKSGLRTLSLDLSFRMKRLAGEPGEISDAINKLAADLQASRTRLAQAERLAVIGEWAASIAHEVRNPLTSIKAFAQIIEEELPKDHDSREYTGIIVEEVDRLNRFAEELLLFSRPDEESNVPVQVGDVLNQTLTLVQRSAAGKGIRIEKTFDDQLPLVMASPELLKHVFLNILINALQAMPDGGRVQIVTEQDGNYVRVHIHNQGLPIAEEHLLSVFEPFFTTKQAGTGLGLSISQRIVHAYGGHISAQNVPDGVRFTVSLPAKGEGSA